MDRIGGRDRDMMGERETGRWRDRERWRRRVSVPPFPVPHTPNPTEGEAGARWQKHTPTLTSFQALSPVSLSSARLPSCCGPSPLSFHPGHN